MELASVSRPTTVHAKLIGIFVVICGLVIFGINFAHADLSLWRQLSVFALLYFISRVMPTRLPQGADYSVAFIIDLILITLYGTSTAVVSGFIVTLLAGLFGKLLGRKESLLRVSIITGQVVLVVGLAGTFYHLVSNPVISFMFAAITYFIVTTFFIALDSVAEKKESFSPSWLAVMRTLYVNFFTLSLLTYLLIYLMRNSVLEMQLFSILLFFVPVMFVSHAFRLSVNIKKSYLNTVRTIARAIEAKDPYTRGHSEHVAELTLAMARELRFPEKDLKKLEFVALLHDAGKIGVPEDILNKPGPLTAEEFEAVQTHSSLGAEILEKIKFLSSQSGIVRHHHERYDGSGYPDGLAGEDIPIEARILAVADAFDAMTTDRPFRQAKTSLQAVEEMQKLAGCQFDPRLVETFKTVLRRRGEI